MMIVIVVGPGVFLRPKNLELTHGDNEEWRDGAVR